MATTKNSLPTRPGAVIWFDGHPYVLDGEPGVATTRRWVGLDDNGHARILDPDDIAASNNPTPAILFEGDSAI